MGNVIKGILIAVVLLGIIFGGVAYSKKKNAASQTGLVSATTGASASGIPDGQATDVSNQFLQLLLNMQNIDLDQTIFEDPAFQNLKDFSVTIVPRGNEGRSNPFAPVGQEGAAASVAASQASAITGANSATGVNTGIQQPIQPNTSSSLNGAANALGSGGAQ